ncbi:hypothetical protein [Moorella sulfitireducens (nom. illeg.)]|nr:hypothetical protein [Moorella sulfitireducens]
MPVALTGARSMFNEMAGRAPDMLIKNQLRPEPVPLVVRSRSIIG